MSEALPAMTRMSVPMVVIEPRKGLFHLGLEGLWHFRELLYFLVWRDVKVRYKQTIIGAGWAVFQPLMTMLVFTAIFGLVVKMPSDGIAYPVFSFSALLLWTFFSQSVIRSGVSLIGEAELIKKVYFPRLIVPLSAGGLPPARSVLLTSDFGLATNHVWSDAWLAGCVASILCLGCTGDGGRIGIVALGAECAIP